MRIRLQDVADHFGVNRGTIRRWIIDGVIPAPAMRLRTGRAIWRTEDIESIEEHLRQKQERR